MRPSSDILKYVYPVGSIYMSMNSTNPEKLFGGTWEQITGRFLWATQNTPGVTGGEKTHVLTIDELPNHNHRVQYSTDGGYNFTNGSFGREDSNGFSDNGYFGVNNTIKAHATWQAHISLTGGGKAHNNMPPYIDVYMRKRIG